MQKRIYFQRFLKVGIFLLFFYTISDMHAQNSNFRAPLTFSVKKGKYLSIALIHHGWIFSFQNQSSKGERTTKLLNLEEKDNTTIFTLTRDTIGEDVLQFTRSNIESAEMENYTIRILWNNSITSPVYKDSRVVVMAFDSSTQFKKEEKKSNTKKAPFSKTKQKSTLEKNRPSKKIPSQETVPPIEIENGIPDEDILNKIKEAYDKKNYEEAHMLISKLIRNLPDESKKLFEIAQYLEHTPKNIRDILDAISFYVKIVKHYPLSEEYKDALKRIMFLQEKYIYVR